MLKVIVGALAKNGSFGYAKGRLVCRAKPNVLFVRLALMSFFVCSCLALSSFRVACNATQIGEVPSGSSAFVRKFCQSADVLRVAAERQRFYTFADAIRTSMCKRRSKATTFAHRGAKGGAKRQLLHIG